MRILHRHLQAQVHHQATLKGGKALLQGKGVDVRKRDVEKVLVRRRFVAKEFANTKAFLLTHAAALSHAVSGRSSSTGGRKIQGVHGRKAHLHAFAERNLLVALPPEVVCWECGSLYGTRDAPARWAAFPSKQLESMGFVTRLAGPCCHRHSSKHLSCVWSMETTPYLLAWKQTWSGCSVRFEEASLSNVHGLRVLSRVLSWKGYGIGLEAELGHQRTGAGRAWAERAWSEEPAVERWACRRPTRPLWMELSRTASDRQRPVRTASHWTDQIWHSQPRRCAEGCRRKRKQTEAHSAGCPSICCQRTAWCESFPGNLTRTWMYSWTRILRGCLPTRRSTSAAMTGSRLVRHWSSTPKGGDVELCRIRTVWNRQGHYGSAWDPECWPQSWPERASDLCHAMAACTYEMRHASFLQHHFPPGEHSDTCISPFFDVGSEVPTSCAEGVSAPFRTIHSGVDRAKAINKRVSGKMKRELVINFVPSPRRHSPESHSIYQARLCQGEPLWLET